MICSDHRVRRNRDLDLTVRNRRSGQFQSKCLDALCNRLPPLIACAAGNVADVDAAAVGFTAAGLVAESYKFLPLEKRHEDLTEWYFNRLRDTHDLFHILTGYGRDALGEASLLGFSYEQNHNPGILFIAYAGARQIKKETGTSAPIFAAINEGRRLGKAAKKLAHMDVEKVMREDLAAARERLLVGKPETYFRCLEIMKSEGLNEEDFMPPEAQAA